jgi:hypothetical protein
MITSRKAAVGYATSVATVRSLRRTGLTRKAQGLVDRTLRSSQERRRKRRRTAVMGAAAAFATAAAVTSAGLIVRHRLAGE